MVSMVDCNPEKGCTALQLLAKDVEEAGKTMTRHEGCIEQIYAMLREQSTQKLVTTISALVSAVGVIITLLTVLATSR